MRRINAVSDDQPIRYHTGSDMRLLRTMKRIALLSLLFALTASARAAAIEEGKPAPAFEAKLLDGTPFSLSAAAGEVLIVNFWATWCEPCREEMPALNAYYQKHRAEGLKVLAISVDEPGDEAKVREVMQAFTFPAALARDANIKGYGRIWRIPLTFVIDRYGVLRKDGWHGDPKIDLPALEKTVTPLLETQ
jgi:cytochrome c biogenesis protein CcmG, thiol:disulfide interchange protein DsbE